MSEQKKLGQLMDYVIAEGGSDLHLAEGRRPIIRVNSQLMPVEGSDELSDQDMDSYFDSVLTDDHKGILNNQGDVDFSCTTNKADRFRGNAYIQKGRKSMALRLIPRHIKTFEELNLPPVLEHFTDQQQGFFLVVGPTGHGKSTTLASMINYINNKRFEHITTIEDPIEYIFEPQKSMIDQREIRDDTSDFHSALRGAFRQDIDVLMVGEMRTPETMATAVTAAETGHLVFSTLHTNTAAQTIDRIIDTFSAEQQDQIRMQLASSLSGVLSQRLIPRVSGGMIPACELLVSTNAVSNLIREKRTHELPAVIETGAEKGMISMNRSLADLVKAGEVSVETAFNYTTKKKVLEEFL